MVDIAITPLEPHRFDVEVDEGYLRTTHNVAVHPEMLEELGVPDIDETRVVLESIRFLLDREPATAIYSEFALAQIGEHFDDYYDELRLRLTPEGRPGLPA